MLSYPRNIAFNHRPLTETDEKIGYGKIDFTILSPQQRQNSLKIESFLLSIGDELLWLEFITDNKDIFNLLDHVQQHFRLGNGRFTALTDTTLKNWQEKLISVQMSKTPLTLRMIGTDFQKKVWRTLMTIPKGTTISYSDLGQKVGSHHRAVAKNGVGRNPIFYFVPCHRVIGKDGSLGGYGGSIALKEKLLQQEQHII